MAGGRRSIAAGLSVTVALAAASVSAAASSPDASARNKDWVAIGVAYGAAAAEQEGVLVLWDGEINGIFKFNVDDNGRVDGTWTAHGLGVQHVEFQNVTAVGDLTYTGGGTVGGDESTLVASGSVRTTGVVEPIGQRVDNNNAVGPLAIDIDVWCDEMWGTWELTVESAFQDAGFVGGGATSFDGTFIGHVRFEGYSDEALAALEEHGVDPELLFTLAADYSIDERVELDEARLDAQLAAVSAASQRLEDTYPSWAEADVYEAVNAHRSLLNVLRNLSDCSRSILGEDGVQEWTDSVSQSLERIIADLVELDVFTGDPSEPQGFASVIAAPDADEPVDAAQATLAYLQLVDFSMRSAVIGAGAFDQAAADRSEQALVDAGSRLLAGLDAAGGTPDDRRRILLAGALMGWQFEVGGTPVDAAAALADLGLTS